MKDFALGMVSMFFIFILLGFPDFFESLSKKSEVFLPEPTRVLLYDNKRCAVYDSTYSGAPVYTMICEDGSVYVTRNWMFPEPRSRG